MPLDKSPSEESPPDRSPPRSKFSGALSALRAKPVPEPVSAPKTAPPEPDAAPPEPDAGRKRGRPRGKRSDPAFKPTTLYLRAATQRAAARLLEDKGGEQDLSELVEQLLAQWTRRRS